MGRSGRRVPGRSNSMCKGSEVGTSKVLLTGGKGRREAGRSEVGSQGREFEFYSLSSQGNGGRRQRRDWPEVTQ